LAVAQASTQSLGVQTPDTAEAATVGPLPEYADDGAPVGIDARTGELILSTTPFVNSVSPAIKPKKAPVLLYVALAAGVLMLSLAAGAALYIGLTGPEVDDDRYVVGPMPPIGQDGPPSPIDSPSPDLPPPAGPSAPIENTPAPTPTPTPAPTPAPTPNDEADPSAETGTLTVIRRSACTLTIDGQPAGAVHGQALAPATHALVCRRHGVVRRASVEIVAGREATHTFRFPRRHGMSSRMSGMSKMGGSMLDIGRDYE